MAEEKLTLLDRKILSLVLSVLFEFALHVKVEKSAIEGKGRLNFAVNACPEDNSRLQSILGDPGAVSSGQNEVNRAEIVAVKVFYKSDKSPWEMSLSKPFPNGSANAGS